MEHIIVGIAGVVIAIVLLAMVIFIHHLFNKKL